MAVILPGPLVHSLKGRLQGSVFRKNTYGITLYSNNWSKRGHGAPTANARFIQASIASQWRDCSDAVKASYEGQQWQYPGGSNFNRNQNAQGSTASKGF